MKLISGMLYHDSIAVPGTNLRYFLKFSIPFLHPGLERETNRVFYFSCRHHLPSLLLYVNKKRTLASITDVPCC